MARIDWEVSHCPDHPRWTEMYQPNNQPQSTTCVSVIITHVHVAGIYISVNRINRVWQYDNIKTPDSGRPPVKQGTMTDVRPIWMDWGLSCAAHVNTLAGRPRHSQQLAPQWGAPCSEHVSLLKLIKLYKRLLKLHSLDTLTQPTVTISQ